MNPLATVVPYGLAFWAVFLWAFIPEFRIVYRAGRAARAARSPDAGSTGVIALGMWVAFALAFPLSHVPAWRFAPSAQIPAFWTGLALLVAGGLLRRHCWRMLGASFTGDVRARSDQQVVTAGAYRFVRHPSYTAGTIMNLGVGIVLGSWVSAALLAAASVAVYTYRMRVEERALLAAIGEPYAAFMRTRKRLVPYLF